MACRKKLNLVVDNSPEQLELDLGPSGGNVPTVLAFDPGRTTGFVSAYVSNVIKVHETKEITALGDIRDTITNLFVARNSQANSNTYSSKVGSRGPIHVVCESFLYRHNLPKVDLSPVEVIGVIRLVCDDLNLPLKFQTPSQAKRFWTTDKLKREGLYHIGSPHIRDATRHLLHYSVFTLRTYKPLKPTS